MFHADNLHQGCVNNEFDEMEKPEKYSVVRTILPDAAKRFRVDVKKTEVMYIGANLKKYNSYEEYVNDKLLDQDLVALFLWRGERTPQNEDEKELQKELLEMKKKGQQPIFYPD